MQTRNRSLPVYCLRPAFFFLLLSFATLPAYGFFGKGVETISRPNADKGPTPIESGIFVLDLNTVNTPGQSFSANVFLAFRWNDPRLAHGQEGIISYPLDEVWHPMVQLYNRQNLWQVIEPAVEVTGDGTASLKFWYWGNFSQPLELTDFPFDTQDFKIQVISVGFNPEEIEFVPSSRFNSGMSENLSVADWHNFEAELVAETIKPLPDGPEVVSVTLNFTGERLTGYYWVKVILPLILVVLLSWAVLWIDPAMPGTQISMAITAMLTLIAYRFSIGATLPNLSYLTRLDYFVLTSTILVFATLVEVVFTSTIARLGQVERARKIDRVARVAFPVLLLGFLLHALVLV
ncbi:MAG: hypothetical protein AB3N33_08970 [Puniceicoccaceae bacterium]